MKNIIRPSLILCTVLASPIALATEPQPADPRCDTTVPLSGIISCLIPTEIATFRKSCPTGSEKFACENPLSAPAAQIECDAVAGEVWCEAWPQRSGNYTYVWSIAATSNGSHSPLMTAQCFGNRNITVTVTSKNGRAGQATTFVNCSAQ